MKKQIRTIRRMGFIRDQEGIMNRYIRESANWKKHLEQTRQFITHSFSQTKAETVAVLGSGWLLDVPLDHLLHRFKHIYLVDIHHPIQIRKKTAALSQVDLIEKDLTGGAVKQIYQLLRETENPWKIASLADRISLTPPLTNIDTDAIISVNLLNQLDIILCDYVREKVDFQQESIQALRTAIQAFHLEWISKKPGCLVTDTLEESVTGNGEISSKTLLYTNLPEGIRHESWWWDFDSQGLYHPGSRTRMEVRAVEWI